MDWRATRWIAVSRLVLLRFFALVGLGLLLGATNPVGLGLGALAILIFVVLVFAALWALALALKFADWYSE